MKKVVISMPYRPEVVTELPIYLEKLRENGFEPILDTRFRRLTEQELIDLWPGVYAHICGADALTEKAIASADSLRIIARLGVGMDTVDIDAATRHGVAVCNTPGAGAETVAEHTLALMLASTRRLFAVDKIVRSGKWEKSAGYSLYRKTLGILGFGNIGKQLAKIVSGFDMKILAYDMYPDEAYAKEHGITFCSVEQILRESDFVSVHLPLTEETRGSIGKKELAMMKPTAQIFNCARGGIIDETALYEALRDGVIFGAGLDVFDQEPVNMDNPLLTLDNLLVSPHNAGTSFEGKNNVLRAAVENVIAITNGETPRGYLNARETAAQFCAESEKGGEEHV